MKKKSLPLSKAYQLLEPGPVVMVTTARKGKPNVMTMTWHMMLDFEPPLLAFVMGQEDYSFETLKETKECVINIPSADLAKIAVGIGSVSGANIDKFKKFDLTQEPAQEVAAPLIGECFANLECKVIDMSMTSQYNMFILEVVKAWITTSKKRQRTLHHCGNGLFTIDGKVIKLPFNKK